ncbi:hypothetical protein LRAMOSA09177 [Lichtheimia ramosa]|uniref:Uncharacterized protein n=1 Tax=Lichtheimia ramosa TaxID=688394 RepID=A0A077WH01_9FUNG|nr:hypothetical protein LRAMOSA09177 [Lichtheimia ramosa]
MKRPSPKACLTTQYLLLGKTAFHPYLHLVRVSYPIIEDDLIAFPRIYPMEHLYPMRVNHHYYFLESLFHHHHQPVTCIFSIIFHNAALVVLLTVHPPYPQALQLIPWIVYIQMFYSCLIIDTLLVIKKEKRLPFRCYISSPPLSLYRYSHIGLDH